LTFAFSDAMSEASATSGIRRGTERESSGIIELAAAGPDWDETMPYSSVSRVSLSASGFSKPFSWHTTVKWSCSVAVCVL
jgi:hypothetical protein